MRRPHIAPPPPSPFHSPAPLTPAKSAPHLLLLSCRSLAAPPLALTLPRPLTLSLSPHRPHRRSHRCRRDRRRTTTPASPSLSLCIARIAAAEIATGPQRPPPCRSPPRPLPTGTAARIAASAPIPISRADKGRGGAPSSRCIPLLFASSPAFDARIHEGCPSSPALFILFASAAKQPVMIRSRWAAGRDLHRDPRTDQSDRDRCFFCCRT